MSFDMTSYALGKKSGIKEGEQNVNLDADHYEFTDDGEGNITVTERSE
jgi:hypothetical protein